MKKILFLVLLLSASVSYSASYYYVDQSSAVNACTSAESERTTSCGCGANCRITRFPNYPQYFGRIDDYYNWAGGCTLPQVPDEETGQCIDLPTVPCTTDNTQQHCGPPSYSGGSDDNPDGSTTDNVSECYSDGSCTHTNTTSNTTNNPDGSSTYSQTEIVSTTTSEGQTSQETTSSTTHTELETSDSGTRLTEETTITDSSGESTTTTTVTDVVHNNDGSTSSTVTVSDTSTGQQISSQTTTTNTDGTTTAAVDCTDVAYVNSPSCRIASFEDQTTAHCDGYTVVGENRCVTQCEEYYVQWGRTCTRSGQDPTEPPEGEDPIVSQLKTANVTVDLIKGINTQIKQNTSNTNQSVKDLGTKLDGIKLAIESQGPNVGGAGGETTVDLDGLIDDAPDSESQINGYKTELQTTFDGIGLQEHIDGITGNEFTEDVSLGDNIRSALPSLGCSTYSKIIPGTDQSITITCADTQDARELFAYLFYILTALYCYQLITSKSA